MSITAAAILDAAYQRSSANDAGKLAGDQELLAHTDRVVQRLWPLIARARPHQFQTDVALPLAGVPPMLLLPADLIDLLDVRTATGAKVHVIPSAERQRRWTIPPSVYRMGRSLVSRNAAGDPIVADVLTLTVLDEPAALVALSSVLDVRWPARHAQLLIDELAAYLSVKDAGRSAEEHAKIMGQLQASMAALAAEFDLGPSVVEWLHAAHERAVPAKGVA